MGRFDPSLSLYITQMLCSIFSPFTRSSFSLATYLDTHASHRLDTNNSDLIDRSYAWVVEERDVDTKRSGCLVVPPLTLMNLTFRAITPCSSRHPFRLLWIKSQAIYPREVSRI